ncbi:hypothetical protein H0X48_00940 [Candidatus Dependentiae bacterium]|nr:hypothetical protein [Candidatus Dependentiae bacterium]
MKKMLLAVLLSLFFICLTNFTLNIEIPSISQKNTIFISLGAQCSPAFALNHYKIRKTSLPFDWIVTNFDIVYKCLEEDFKNFLIKESLYIDPKEPIYVRDSYGIGYMHDFPAYSDTYHIKENFLDHYDEVMTKYQRRINRLRDILKSNNIHVVFIRLDHELGGTKDKAIKLRDLISLKYPHLDFTYVLLTCTEESKVPWDLPRIKNFFMPWNDIWNYESEAWIKALTEIKVISSVNILHPWEHLECFTYEC